MNLKSALGLSRRGWWAVIDNALTGVALALIAAGICAFGAGICAFGAGLGG